MPRKPLKKILIVEDDVFLANIYMKKFSSEGYDIFFALDGKKGFSLIKQKKPDLVLLDIMLPEMNGFEILENMQKDEELKDIPVILLTNINQRDDIERGYSLGAKDYIIKTFFTPGEVVEKVKRFI